MYGKLLKTIKIRKQKVKKPNDFFLNVFLLFIYFWLRWVFVAAHGLSPVAGSGGCCSFAMHRLLIAVASLVAEHGL